MQIKLLFLVVICVAISCKEKVFPLRDGFYYNKELKELMIIKENGKKQEIYSILLNTYLDKAALHYYCMECPNGETKLKLIQDDSLKIQVITEYEQLAINLKYFQKFDFNSNGWDSIKICSFENCTTLHSALQYPKYLYSNDKLMSLNEEMNVITQPLFYFYNNVTDDVPVEITIFYKNKDVLIRKTRGIDLYFGNLRYIVYTCLSDQTNKEKIDKVKDCNFSLK